MRRGGCRFCRHGGGRECKIVWSPIEYVNSYCEYKDGNYYDLNGNIVSEKEYRKQCEKHSCEVIDGTYYGKDGKEVSKSNYIYHYNSENFSLINFLF